MRRRAAASPLGARGLARKRAIILHRAATKSRHRMRPFAILLLVVGGVSWALGAEQKPQITFELVTKTGVPLTASQEWHRALSELGLAGLQIRPARASDEMEIKQDPKSSPPRYRVVGILGADNVLQLPGGKFKLSDTARLRKWLDSLGDEGAEGVTAERTTFG